MEKILIIGCPGSGKTRMANALGRKLDLPVIHLDTLWSSPRGESVTVQEFDQKLDAILESPAWILDGNFSRTMPMRLQSCDTIIYLDHSRRACLWGMLRQALEGSKQINWRRLSWAYRTHESSRTQNSTWIAQARHAQVIVLKSRKEANAFLSGQDF